MNPDVGGSLSERSRVMAFSDGVLAIVITLLALDLHVPQERGQMLHLLLQQWPVYMAYLASFAFIGVIWVNHHQLFTHITAVDAGLIWRNLALLLIASILPFPTAVLGAAFQHGSGRDQTTGLVLYALVSAASASTWLLLYRYLANNKRLLRAHTPASFFAHEQRRALTGVAFYFAAAVMAIWQPIVGLFITIVLPVFFGITSEGWLPNRTRRSGPDAGAKD